MRFASFFIKTRKNIVKQKKICYTKEDFRSKKGQSYMKRSELIRTPGLCFSYSRHEHPIVNEYRLHAHEDYELFYFVSGRGTYSVEGNEYRLSPGCVLLMRIGETHMMHIDPDAPYERFVINFTAEALSSIDPRGILQEPYLSRPVGQQNLYMPNQLNQLLVRGCFDAILSAADSEDATQRLAILCNLRTILYDVQRAFLLHTKPLSGLPEAQGLIAAVVDYINCNLTETLSLDALSARFFLSKSYLNQQFRQSTGTTIWDYVLLKRLMLARTSIRGGASVTEAFHASGFNDYSSFYRRYKSRFGISPKDDRPRVD